MECLDVLIIAFLAYFLWPAHGFLILILFILFSGPSPECTNQTQHTIECSLAENSEHVPLLVTPPAAAVAVHNQNSSPLNATTITMPKSTKVTNGNGLLINSSNSIRPSQISPVTLSSPIVAAHVMRARLNQYKVAGVVVNFDQQHGDVTTTTTTTTKATSAAAATTKAKAAKKMKTCADI